MICNEITIDCILKLEAVMTHEESSYVENCDTSVCTEVIFK